MGNLIIIAAFVNSMSTCLGAWFDPLNSFQFLRGALSEGMVSVGACAGVLMFFDVSGCS